MPIRIFISYSHKDAEFRRKLEIHLAALKREGVGTFYDGDIHPGGDLDAAIRRELRAADIFVALASPEYLHSEYCFAKEYSYALGRARRKTMHVVVAVIRPCQWKHTRMARYKALPEDGKEVVKWGSRDSAFEDIVNGVRRVVKLAQAVNGTELTGKRPRNSIEPKTEKASTRTAKPSARRRSSKVQEAKQGRKVPKAAASMATSTLKPKRSSKAKGSKNRSRRPKPSTGF